MVVLTFDRWVHRRRLLYGADARHHSFTLIDSCTHAQARKEEAWTAGTKALADAQSSLGASTLSSKSTSVAHEETLVVREQHLCMPTNSNRVQPLVCALSPQTRRQGLRQAIQEQREELVQRKIGALSFCARQIDFIRKPSC